MHAAQPRLDATCTQKSSQPCWQQVGSDLQTHASMLASLQPGDAECAVQQEPLQALPQSRIPISATQVSSHALSQQLLSIAHTQVAMA